MFRSFRESGCKRRHFVSVIMSKKKPFVLRINPEALEELEKWAADEFRSVNGQIEYLLQKALNERKKSKGKNNV
jgi:hypothetical protein